MIKLPNGSSMLDRREQSDGKYLLRWMMAIFSAIILILLTTNMAWMSRVDDRLVTILVTIEGHGERIKSLEGSRQRGGGLP